MPVDFVKYGAAGTGNAGTVMRPAVLVAAGEAQRLLEAAASKDSNDLRSTRRRSGSRRS
jgi:hypothetical protein